MSQLRLVTDQGDPEPQTPPVVALFCGSRDFDDRAIIETLLHGVSAVATLRGRPMVVVEGEARGADTLARAEAEHIGIEVWKFPADWNGLGKKAGPIRNQEMLDRAKPDIVVAFSDDIRSSAGTRDMATRAKRAGIPVYVVSRFHHQEVA